MQYIIKRDKAETIALMVEDGKVTIRQHIGRFLRTNAVFLTLDEAATIAKEILKEAS